jgi:hypothetical protein
MEEKNTCESCGMPMRDTSQHGGKDVNNPYCIYCTDETGKLKSREQVREGMIGFFMKSENKTREDAEKHVDEHMKKMPAWKE